MRCTPLGVEALLDKRASRRFSKDEETWTTTAAEELRKAYATSRSAGDVKVSEILRNSRERFGDEIPAEVAMVMAWAFDSRDMTAHSSGHPSSQTPETTPPTHGLPLNKG